MMYLYFILLFIIVILVIFKLYIKIKYKFWAHQPMFHNYNLYYKYFKRGIINYELPKINKYYNFYNVIVDDYQNINDNTIKEIINLLQNESHPFNPKNNHKENNNIYSKFSSYFIGCNNKSFVSIYYKKKSLFDKTEKGMLYSIMTTRALNITLNNLKIFKIYYIDYLCISNDYKNDDIINELFQTHEYIQRHKNKDIKSTLFKSTKKIPGIIALTKYNIYNFDFNNILKQQLPCGSMQLIEITKQNIQLIISLIYSQKNRIECFIIPDLTNLLNLINNDIYKIYGIIQHDILISCYFFRNNNTVNYTIECYSSISNCYYKTFFIGFCMAIEKLKAKHVIIESISDNYIIINYIFSLNIKPMLTKSVFFYFYNYIIKPISSDKMFILI